MIEKLMMSYRYAYLVILSSAIIAFGLPAYKAICQERADSLTETEHRWLVTLSLATTSSGPAADIEKAMVASGFNQTSYGGFFSSGPIAHPFSRTGFGEIGSPWMIGLHYSIRPPLSLGVIVSNTPIGTTIGYHDPYLFLFVDYSVFTISSIVSIQFLDILHIGIGPAVYNTKSYQDNAGVAAESKSVAKIGALLDIELSIPAHSHLFGVVSIQYRYVGKVDIGPFESRLGDSAATIPATNGSYDHTFIAIGVGLRL